MVIWLHYTFHKNKHNKLLQSSTVHSVLYVLKDTQLAFKLRSFSFIHLYKIKREKVDGGIVFNLQS